MIVYFAYNGSTFTYLSLIKLCHFIKLQSIGLLRNHLIKL